MISRSPHFIRNTFSCTCRDDRTCKHGLNLSTALCSLNLNISQSLKYPTYFCTAWKKTLNLLNVWLKKNWFYYHSCELMLIWKQFWMLVSGSVKFWYFLKFKTMQNFIICYCRFYYAWWRKTPILVYRVFLLAPFVLNAFQQQKRTFNVWVNFMWGLGMQG